MRKFRMAPSALAALAALALQGCNLFDPFDNPTSDEQILSAARACFDHGDIACAQELYQKLSGDKSEVAASEQAFAILDQQGADMAAFMEFVGNGGSGAALTALAEKLIPGAGQSRRSALYQAFLKKDSITRNADLKNFVELITSIALAAEMLAEYGSESTLSKSAIASTPGSCDVATCAVNANCGIPASGLPGGSASDISTTDPGASATANADHIYWAIDHAIDALNALNPGGSFGTTLSGLQAIFNEGQPSSLPPVSQRCFRAQMLNFGIGR